MDKKILIALAAAYAFSVDTSVCMNDEIPSMTIKLDSRSRYPSLEFFTDKDGKKKPCYCWNDTGKRTNLREVLRVKGYNKDLPTTREAFDKYREIYYSMSEDNLIDSANNDFWGPIEKIVLEIVFSCIEGINPTPLFPKLRKFTALLSTCNDSVFKHFMFNHLFDYTGLAATHTILKSCPYRCDLTKKDLFVDVVRDELNDILNTCDSSRSYIRWRFNSSYK